MASEHPVARERGGDDRCPPGYPHCCGCDEVFDSIEEIPDHDCPEGDDVKAYTREEEAFRRIKPVDEVESEVRQMEDNVRELLSELRMLEWQLLGGRGTYDPERCQRLCEGTARGMESIADQIADLPDPYEEDSDD